MHYICYPELKRSLTFSIKFYINVIFNCVLHISNCKHALTARKSIHIKVQKVVIIYLSNLLESLLIIYLPILAWEYILTNTLILVYCNLFLNF